MKHSGCWPDYKPRLFRRGCAYFSERKVHERLVFKGVPGKLHASILHDSTPVLQDAIDKMNVYSRLGAEQMYQDGKKSSLTLAILKGGWAFFRTYFLRLGFLDGKEGFMFAILNAEGTYYRYLRLMLLSCH